MDIEKFKQGERAWDFLGRLEPTMRVALNAILEQAKSLEVRTGDGLEKTSSGAIRPSGPPEPIRARLTGGTGPYSWVEQQDTPSGLADLSGGRSGTSNAYEANNCCTNLTGQRVLLHPAEQAGDYRFQWLKYGAACGAIDVTVRGCGGTPPNGPVQEGATVTIKQGVTVIGTGITNAAGVVSISIPAAGTYTVEATKTSYSSGVPSASITATCAGPNTVVVGFQTCKSDWSIIVSGCLNSIYTGGGTVEIRSDVDDTTVLSSASIGGDGIASGIMEFPCAPNNHVKLHIFPTDTRYTQYGVGSAAIQTFCQSLYGFGSGGNPYTFRPGFTLQTNQASTPKYTCCPTNAPPVPQTLHLTDNAGTTTLTFGLGNKWTGQTTFLIPNGKTTASNCTAATGPITIDVYYEYVCLQYLRVIVSWCSANSGANQGFRSRTDTVGINVTTASIGDRFPTSISWFPVNIVFPADATTGLNLGATSIVE